MGLEMISDPWSVQAEHVRLVRSGLERELGDDCTSLLVTSATEDDGASAAVANLAVALARAGRRAAVVDLDLRAPALHTLFGVDRAPGMADAARGMAAGAAVARAVEVDGPGELLVVPAGAAPPSPSEVLSSPLLSAELAELGARSDVVLIDGPPLLVGGDALELTTRVDAVLFVASVRGFRRSYARDLRRLLAAAPAPTLGVIVVDHTVGQPARRARRSRRPEKATYATG
jgi:Mrp family chromosome partitioning ATPase